MTLYLPQAGDVGFTPVSGVGGRLIRKGEELIHENSPYQHVFQAVSQTQGIQAEPGGAKLFDLTDWPQAVYATPPAAVNKPLVCLKALRYLGTKYSFLDYTGIYVHDKRLPIVDPAVGWYVHQTRHMICSQLVAQAFEDAGYPIVTLGLAQDVDPGLFWNLVTHDDAWSVHQ